MLQIPAPSGTECEKPFLLSFPKLPDKKRKVLWKDLKENWDTFLLKSSPGFPKFHPAAVRGICDWPESPLPSGQR